MGSSASKHDAQQPLPSFLAYPVAILKPSFYATQTLQKFKLTKSITNKTAIGLHPDKNVKLIVSECRTQGLLPLFAIRLSNQRIPLSICGVKFKDAWAETRECLVDLGSGLEVCHAVHGQYPNIYSSSQQTILCNYESRTLSGSKLVFTALNHLNGSLTRFIIKGTNESSCTVFIRVPISTSASQDIPVARLFENKSNQQGSQSWWHEQNSETMLLVVGGMDVGFIVMLMRIWILVRKKDREVTLMAAGA
jgi:hypothetical protein